MKCHFGCRLLYIFTAVTKLHFSNLHIGSKCSLQARQQAVKSPLPTWTFAREFFTNSVVHYENFYGIRKKKRK